MPNRQVVQFGDFLISEDLIPQLKTKPPVLRGGFVCFAVPVCFYLAWQVRHSPLGPPIPLLFGVLLLMRKKLGINSVPGPLEGIP